MPDSNDTKRRSGLTGSGSAVARLMGEAKQRQQEQETHGRGKPGHGGQLGQDSAGRKKVTYNLTLARQTLVRQMAAEENVSQADIAEAAIVMFYNAWRSGKVDLEDLREPARSLKVLWKLQVPDDFESFSD